MHTGGPSTSAASALGAVAYADGGELHIPESTLAARSHADQRIVAHEAAHALQQADAPRFDATTAVLGTRDDRYEREADTFADWVVRNPRTLRSAAPRLSRAPASTIQRAPKPTATRFPRLPGETQIRALLEREIVEGDLPAAKKRSHELEVFFRSYASPAREQLRDRLRTSAPGDELAYLFHSRLHTATRAHLIGVLDAPVVSVYKVDANQLSKFALMASYEDILTTPDPHKFEPLVLDSVTSPTVTISATFWPQVLPPDGSDIWLEFRLQTPAGTIAATERRRVPGDTHHVTEPFAVEVDQPGEYIVWVDIITDGILEITLQTPELRVVLSDLEKLRRLDDEELRTQAKQLRETDPTSQKLRDIEWIVIQERGQQLREYPVDTLKRDIVSDRVRDWTTIDGLPLGPDAETIRYQLESTLSYRSAYDVIMGLWRAKNALVFAGLTSGAAADVQEATRRLRIAEEQLLLIFKAKKIFVEQLNVTMQDLLRLFLQEARAGVQQARQQYGLGLPSGSPASDQANALVDASVALANLREKLDDEELALGALLEGLYHVGGPDVRYSDPFEQVKFRESQAIYEIEALASGNYPQEERVYMEDRVSQYKMKKVKRDELKKQYDALFLKTEAKFPILATVREGHAETIKKLTNVDTMRALLAPKINDVEENCEKVESHIFYDSPEDIWKLDRLVASAKLKLRVRPHSLEEKWVNETIDDADSWLDTALTVIGIGLAILAAPFSAGSSLALAAELLALAIDAYVLYEDVKEYQFGMAAAHSHMDPLRALASEEPSLLPIFLDVIGLGISVGSLAKAIGAAAKLRRAVKAGANEAERRVLVDELNAIGHTAKLDKELGDAVLEKLVKEEAAAPYVKRLQHALSGTEAEAKASRVNVRVAEDAEMDALGGSAHATVIVDNGEVTLVVRKGADPAVVREEAIHVRQLLDPSRAAHRAALDEAHLANWSKLTPKQKLPSIRAKLDLEVDAQKRVIRELRDQKYLSPEDMVALDNAWQNLEHLRGRFAEWTELEQAVARGADVADNELLKDAPRLYNKPTRTEFEAIDLANKSEDEFVKAYRDRTPHSTLSDDELRDRYKDGKRINPETLALYTPGRRGAQVAEVSAEFKGKGVKLSTATPQPKGYRALDLSDEARKKTDALLAQRDAARAERDALIKAGDEEAAAKKIATINEKSRLIGELHADEYMRTRFPGYKKVYPGPNAGSRAGDFDQVWAKVKINAKGEEEWLDAVIIESKGGAGRLGTRRVGGQVVEQGTRPYYDDIVENMRGFAPEIADGLNQVGRRRTKYLLIHTPIESGAPSITSQVIVKMFDF